MRIRVIVEVDVDKIDTDGGIVEIGQYPGTNYHGILGGAVTSAIDHALKEVDSEEFKLPLNGTYNVDIAAVHLIKD